MTNASRDLTTKLDPLRPFVKRIATVRSPMQKLYSYFLRASFVRAFEFVDIASKQKSNSAFFLVPALRGITEEIIYLRFLSRFAHESREQVVYNMIQLEVEKGLKYQKSFFQTFRPFQPILPLATIDTTDIKDQLRSFWQKNGWPRLNQEIPPTREIAEKSDPVLLHIVYDFIYRLTSGTVHFNPQVLLRSGWGNDSACITFSSRNMGAYYLAVSQIYGSYLLCLYFELFGRFLRPNQKEKYAVKEVRGYLLSVFRWPEMITFEEMNIDVPQPKYWPTAIIHVIYNTVMEDGFISGAEQIIQLNEQQRSRSGKETL